MFREPSMYRDREAAGRFLSRSLALYAGDDPVVIGIPRGAMPVARVVANELQCDLDICLVRKIEAPCYPGMAIGAVNEAGNLTLCNGSGSLGLSRRYVDEMCSREAHKLRQQRVMYNKQPVSLHRRTVILVDDGIMTGSSMLAAVQAVRAQKPSKVVVAAPVASAEAVARLRRRVDDLVVPHVPKSVVSIAQFYLDFPGVSDEDVIAALGTTPQYKVPALGITLDGDEMARRTRPFSRPEIRLVRIKCERV